MELGYLRQPVLLLLPFWMDVEETTLFNWCWVFLYFFVTTNAFIDWGFWESFFLHAVDFFD